MVRLSRWLHFGCPSAGSQQSDGITLVVVARLQRFNVSYIGGPFIPCVLSAVTPATALAASGMGPV